MLKVWLTINAVVWIYMLYKMFTDETFMDRWINRADIFMRNVYKLANYFGKVSWNRWNEEDKN